MGPESRSHMLDGWILVLLTLALTQREETNGQALCVLPLLAYLVPGQNFGKNKLLLTEPCPNNTQILTQSCCCTAR